MTIEAPYFYLLIALAFFNLSWEGLKFNSTPYFIYKFGETGSLNKADQSDMAYAQIAVYLPRIVMALVSGLFAELNGKRMYIALFGTIMLTCGHISYINLQECRPLEGDSKLPSYSQCPNAFWAPTIASLGAGVFPVLLSSISYLAINSIQGLAFGVAFSFM
jgi:hypothetical protein